MVWTGSKQDSDDGLVASTNYMQFNSPRFAHELPKASLCMAVAGEPLGTSPSVRRRLRAVDVINPYPWNRLDAHRARAFVAGEEQKDLSPAVPIAVLPHLEPVG